MKVGPPPMNDKGFGSIYNYIRLEIKKLDPEATVPTKANRGDAGFDLYSVSDATIQPNSREVIKTGISMAIPDGFSGLIWPRSGMAVKQGIDVFAGVVDAGYRGEVMVCLYNSSESPVEVSKGDRIAQMLIQPVPLVRIAEVSNLDDTSRGDGGFGSSGK